jgi:restriction system protein
MKNTCELTYGYELARTFCHIHALFTMSKGVNVSRRIWTVRAGRSGQADEIFMARKQLAINFSEVDGDASKLPATRSAFREAFSRLMATDRPSAIPISAGQLYRFVHDMRIDDYVIYPRKSDRTLHWGTITGPYIYDTEGSNEYAHRRSVKWIAKRSRDSFSQGALYELGSILTLFEVKNFADEFIRKFEGPASLPPSSPNDDETESSAVIDVSETTRDFIMKRIKTDLKGYPFEPFIADLFHAMGYHTRTTQSVRDDGIDVIAHRDELGIEPPIIKIQVKVQEANVSGDSVKAFYAMVHERDVGIFMTTGGYTGPALDFARTKGNLKLMNGVDVVELIERHYDKLESKHRQLIPLRRVLVPDVGEDD